MPRQIVVFGVCLFAASLALSVAGANIGWGLILVGLLLAPSTRRYLLAKWRGNRLFWPWTAYLGISALSAVFGVDPIRSIHSLIRWDFTHALAYFLLVTALTEEASRRGARWYLAGSVAAALFGIGQVCWSYAATGKIAVQYAAHATVYHITYGELMAFALSFCFSLMVSPKLFPVHWGAKFKIGWEGYLNKSLLPVVFTIIYTALILSQARGAWLATVAIFGCYLLYPASRKKALIFAVANLALLASAFALSPRFHAASALTGRVTSIFSTSFDSNQAHLVLWKTGLAIFKDHPVLGVGPGNVRTEFSRYHPEPLWGATDWGNLHNLYLHQLVERGIAGLLALGVLLFCMVRLAWRQFHARPDAATLCALMTLPGFLVMNLTETSFQHAVIAFSIGWLLALAQNS